MLPSLIRHWWLLLIRGIAAILFGIIAFLWPGITLLALVILFGAFAIVDGVTALWLAITGRDESDSRRPWWAMVLVGILGIAAGLITVFWPGITALALLAVIAAWAILRGVLEIVAAIRLRREIRHEWLLVLTGLVSIAFGIFLVLNPGAGAVAVAWIIGAFSAALGVLAVALAFRLRMLKESIEHVRPE